MGLRSLKEVPSFNDFCNDTGSIIFHFSLDSLRKFPTGFAQNRILGNIDF